MPAIIKIENLGKRYRIKSQRGYVNLKEVLSRQLSRVRRKIEPEPGDVDFWALRDISLDIEAGELIGLVGRNGSGKSTLLKLLAEVTKPTTGRISLWWRIGSLLEIGTGFHPELSGRENIFLSGSILGMPWKEVAKKFDEIVAFSETQEFLNVQVKRYSSGMYMRLAFSVAAHLDPDILLIDEALAVGDANFRRKCLDKMRSFTRQGATVIFVSHNMSLISDSCSRCLLLEKGCLVADGPSQVAIQRYLQQADTPKDIVFDQSLSINSGNIALRGMKINEGKQAAYAQSFSVEVAFETMRPDVEFSLGFGFCDLEGRRLLSCEIDASRKKVSCPQPGKYAVTMTLPSLDLGPGGYLLDLWARDPQRHTLDSRTACARIEVVCRQGETSSIAREFGIHQGCNWEMRF